MTPIDQGVDCTRRLKKPRTTLRLERSTIYAEPGKLYLLRLLEVPEECPPHCYFWIHAQGGGTLIEDVGKAVWFMAPMDNEDCKGSAVIEVFCGSRRIDIAYITLSTFPMPHKVHRWFQNNRTHPAAPAEYLKYRAVVIKSRSLHWAIKVDRKTHYIRALPPSDPTQVNLFLVSRSYDCNGIYLQTLHYGRYNAPITLHFLAIAMAHWKGTPLVVDARSPFLKGEPVTMEEGTILPPGWKPNSRRIPGLHVPYGTIWPEDWKRGDPLPRWQCCPTPLLTEDVF